MHDKNIAEALFTPQHSLIYRLNIQTNGSLHLNSILYNPHQVTEGFSV